MKREHDTGRPRGRVAIPATCGELVQGTSDGIPCLISCPIDFFSVVEVEIENRGGKWTNTSNVTKTMAALRAALHHIGCDDLGGRVTVTSALPRSKGYGSSTADMCGAIYAIGEALGRPFSPYQVAQLAVAVEPSNGTMFPGLALFAHRTGEIYEDLGPAPALDIIVIDCGGEVDTLAFNRVDWSATLKELAPQHREAFKLAREGFRQGALDLLGRGATLSSLAHQRILPKLHLEAVLCLARDVGALGVNVAHSGTLIGILLSPGDHNTQDVVTYLAKRLRGYETLFATRLVDGGPRYLIKEEVSQVVETG